MFAIRRHYILMSHLVYILCLFLHFFCHILYNWTYHPMSRDCQILLERSSAYKQSFHTYAFQRMNIA